MHRITIAAAALAITAPFAAAGITGFATTVESFDQALEKDGSAVSGNRSNPADALGMPQNNNTLNFVSLGMGGSITLSFDALFTEQVTIWETTYSNPAGHYETADIHVGFGTSVENADWWLAGSVANTADGLPLSLADASALAGRNTFAFLRVTDTTPQNSSSFDGFDLDGVSATLVPSPGAAALLALGGLTAARRRRN